MALKSHQTFHEKQCCLGLFSSGLRQLWQPFTQIPLTVCCSCGLCSSDALLLVMTHGRGTVDCA